MTGTNLHDDWLTNSNESDGELSVDVYHDEHTIYILAPIAGVKTSDIDVSITEGVVTIHGERKPPENINSDKFFIKECFWGPFSRSYSLPMAVNAEGAKATLKDGLLKLAIPKDEKAKTKTIAINSDDLITSGFKAKSPSNAK